jgi:hypothetical protein
MPVIFPDEADFEHLICRNGYLYVEAVKDGERTGIFTVGSCPHCVEKAEREGQKRLSGETPSPG